MSENPDLTDLPEDNLRWRVCGTKDIKCFRNSGNKSLENLQAVLSLVSTSTTLSKTHTDFTDYPRILEFGCGCGRILLHTKHIGEKSELHGTDIDAEAIDWCKKHIPWVKFAVNSELPPLEYPDNHFDLIFNHSVFTHIDEQHQDAWLAELVRITKPNGVVILSVHGDFAFAKYVMDKKNNGINTTENENHFNRNGFVFVNEGYKFPNPDFYNLAFHAYWYVFTHWGKCFDIKAYVVRGALDYQDIVLMYKPS